MTVLRRCVRVIYCLLAGAFPAAANDVVPPDPWQVIHVARAFGPAEVGRDAMRDPQITGEIDGVAYRLDFYGCWLHRECETVLFRAHLFAEDWEPDADKIAEWNAARLFGRAWIDPDGGAVLDQALPMRAGLPKDTLTAGFEAWRDALTEFSEHLDFE